MYKFRAISGSAWKMHSLTPPKSAKVKLRTLVAEPNRLGSRLFLANVTTPFAGGCLDRLGVERRIAAGDVGVELGSRIVAVMSVEVGGGAAAAAGPEKLAVQRRTPELPNIAASGSRCCWLTSR